MQIRFKEGALEKIAEVNAQRRLSYPALKRLAEKYDKEDNRVMDIGIHGDVYPGGHFFLFENASYETVDIDPHVAPTHVEDIRELTFDDKTFDLIICHSVIEHVLEHREKAYDELYRVLKPGGTIFYVIPSIIDDREVEPAKFVSQTKIREHYKDMDYDFRAMDDKTFEMEVRK